MKKHHTISSLIENLHNSIGTGYICKGTEKFLKTGRHVIRKIQFNVVLWERILKKDYAMIFHHAKENLNSGAIMARQFCENLSLPTFFV